MYGRSREDMEYHVEHEDWDAYCGTKRHGHYLWNPDMGHTEYIQKFYRSTKGRATDVFRPSKPRDKK